MIHPSKKAEEIYRYFRKTEVVAAQRNAHDHAILYVELLYGATKSLYWKQTLKYIKDENIKSIRLR